MTFAKDIGIDLGTASVLVYVKGKGVVLNEPSVVAMDKTTGKLLKVGTDAQAMQRAGSGCRVAAISAAIRYIHSPVSVGCQRDFVQMEQLARLFLEKMEVRHD